MIRLAHTLYWHCMPSMRHSQHAYDGTAHSPLAHHRASYIFRTPLAPAHAPHLNFFPRRLWSLLCSRVQKSRSPKMSDCQPLYLQYRCTRIATSMWLDSRIYAKTQLPEENSVTGRNGVITVIIILANSRFEAMNNIMNAITGCETLWAWF